MHEIKKKDTCVKAAAGTRGSAEKHGNVKGGALCCCFETGCHFDRQDPWEGGRARNGRTQYLLTVLMCLAQLHIPPACDCIFFFFCLFPGRLSQPDSDFCLCMVTDSDSYSF